MRLRVAFKTDAAENRRKSKKPKTGKAKQVFTEVGEESGEETHVEDNEDEAIELSEEEDEDAHASDDE